MGGLWLHGYITERENMEIKRFIDGKEVVITLTEDEVQDAGRIADFTRLCADVKDQIGYTTYKKAFADMAPEKLAEAVEDIASDVGYELTYYSGKSTQIAAISKALYDYCKNNDLPEDPGTVKAGAEKTSALESEKLLVKDIASRATNGTLITVRDNGNGKDLFTARPTALTTSKYANAQVEYIGIRANTLILYLPHEEV